jgi:hypothetical protein
MCVQAKVTTGDKGIFPCLAPGRYFRLLLIGYFEGLDAERAIAWRAADSFGLREFLGLVVPTRKSIREPNRQIPSGDPPCPCHRTG